MKRAGFIVIVVPLFFFGSGALAAPCQQGITAERLACLSKRLGDLEAQVKTLKQTPPKAGPAGPAVQSVPPLPLGQPVPRDRPVRLVLLDPPVRVDPRDRPVQPDHPGQLVLPDLPDRLVQPDRKGKRAIKATW
jgi:hypothetical protein